MVLQSLENFDDGYGEFDETGAQVEEPEGFSSLVEGADAILLEEPLVVQPCHRGPNRRVHS